MPHQSAPTLRVQLRAVAARAGQALFKAAAWLLARLRRFPPGAPAYLSWHARAWQDYLDARDAAGQLDPETIETPQAVDCLVSIVLPVYNGERYLAEAIDSILAQTYRQWELIIVDDGSVDDSAAIAREFTTRDARIHFVRQPNQKLPAALNTGFARARGEFLTWTSDDNRLKPEFLVRLVSELRADPAADMLYANYEIIDAAGALLRGDRWCAALQEPPGSGQVHVFRDTTALNLIPGNFIGPAFMFRARTLALVGGFDPRWFTVEDYDFALRVNEQLVLRHAGFAECIYEYRLHGRALSAGGQAERELLATQLLAFDDFRREQLTRVPEKEETETMAAWAEAIRAATAEPAEFPVSIIICTRREPEFCLPVLKGLAAQTRCGFELLIVDDRPEKSAGFERVLQSCGVDRPARVVRGACRGLSAARNRGLLAARGAVVAYLDDDTTPAPDWLAQLLTAFAAHTECDVIGGAIDVRDPFPRPGWWSPRARRYWSEYRPGVATFHHVAEWRRFPHGGNWAARRLALLRIGGFREQFGHRAGETGAGEEILAALQIQRCGGSIGIEPRACVVHEPFARRCTRRDLWVNMLAGWRVRLRLEAGLYIPRQTSPLGQVKDTAYYAAKALKRRVLVRRRGRFAVLEAWMQARISAVLLWDFMKLQLGRLRRPRN